jgi:hypothetical protein
MAFTEVTLSPSELCTLALLKRKRRAGLLPTVEEIDFVLDVIDQLLTPVVREPTERADPWPRSPQSWRTQSSKSFWKMDSPRVTVKT